ncbi:MAG: response regulator [Xanthobacteraceae bacterium]|nr:response regulator [Xanthobacteraceae bacterium]
MNAGTAFLHWIAKPRSFLRAFAIMVAALALATGTRFLLGFFVPTATLVPFGFYFPAVLIAAATGGFITGFLATIIAVLVSSYLFLGMRDMPTMEQLPYLIQIGVFAVNCGIIALVAAALRNALIRRRRAEDARQLVSGEREEFFRTLDAVLAHAPIGYGFVDRDFAYAQVNSELTRVLGVRNEYIVGRPIEEFPPLNAPDAIEAIREVFETGLSISGLELLRETPGDPGSPRAWLAGFFPVRNERGEVEVVGAALLDIAEHKKAEIALGASERKFRVVTNAMPQLVWSNRPDGTFDFYNEQCIEFAGTPPGTDWKELLHPDDRERTRKAWEHSLKTGEPYEIEYRFRSKRGEYHWFLARALPVLNNEGKIERWFGTATDITEIVAARTAEMLAANEKLRGEVFERSIAEERLRSEIQERARAEEQLRQASKMEAVGRLTGGLAHDFNNLLTVVMGNIEAMQRKLKDGGEDKIKNYAEFAMQGAKRAAALTKRLLAFSRGQPLDPEPLNANELVSSMTELFARTLGEKVGLKTAIVENLWTVEADPNQLEASLLNLVVNARDAMPKGGSLTIETSNVKLDASYAAKHEDVTPGEYVAITVSDTGVGMDEETLARVFEPFFTTKPAGEGTGLGLSQLYGFVKQSGGHVSIDSIVGSGTKATMYLPRYFGEGAGRKSGRKSHSAEDDRNTVLIVEDDDDVRQYSVSLFRELGYGVLEAADGASALRILETRPEIRFMFTDVGLPGDYNGKELADEARRRRPYLRVLYTTGYARADILRQGRLDANAQVVTKPFTFDELSTKVRSVFDGKNKNVILLVEDEVLVAAIAAENLRDIGFEVIEVTSAKAALAHMAKDGAGLKAAIVDIGLPDKKGDVLAAELRKLRGDLPIIVATGHASESLPKELREAKKVAVLGKPYDLKDLKAALVSVGVAA